MIAWLQSINWEVLANGATCFIALFAVIGIMVAVLQLKSFKKQQRFSAYLDLINQLSEEASREARRSIHLGADNLTTGESATDNKTGREYRRVKADIDEKELTDAIDLTVNQLDKVGFFMSHDYGLPEEAPKWLWEVTMGMWDRVGHYVKTQRCMSRKPYRKHYGEDFETLMGIARKRYPGKTPKKSKPQKKDEILEDLQ